MEWDFEQVMKLLHETWIGESELRRLDNPFNLDQCVISSLEEISFSTVLDPCQKHRSGMGQNVAMYRRSIQPEGRGPDYKVQKSEVS